MNPHARLLAMIAERDAQEAFSRALCWGILVTHTDAPEVVLGLYGLYNEPAAALEHAAGQERELNIGEEDGFRCQVHPIMPVT